jgi:hypothetical protein
VVVVDGAMGVDVTVAVGSAVVTVEVIGAVAEVTVEAAE